ncbi:MAG: hypothetical protein U1F53_07780 [Burkholderiaceae bacterium]
MLHPDIWLGLKQGLLLGTAALALVVPTQPVRLAPRPSAVPAPASPLALLARLRRELEAASLQPSADLRRVAEWVVGSHDNAGLPFAIIDKKQAQIFLFDAQGAVLGASPALLGRAPGDDSVPGIGQRPIAAVRPEERTTPAGRFVTQPGRNASHENVLWVDYEAAVSMHRVRLSNPAEHRLERLNTPDIGDNRISYGCINLPPAFFNDLVWPRFSPRGGVTYVLPEVKPLDAVFPAVPRLAPKPEQAPETGAFAAI